jgi:hypothetical protein
MPQVGAFRLAAIFVARRSRAINGASLCVAGSAAPLRMAVGALNVVDVNDPFPRLPASGGADNIDVRRFDISTTCIMSIVDQRRGNVCEK